MKINWANVLSRKDKIVKKHSKGIEFLFKKNKVDWVQGWGRYEGPGRVNVEKDGKKTVIEAANILMVSGSEAKSLPGIEPDHKTILTNRSILQLPEIPKTLIVVGAGAVDLNPVLDCLQRPPRFAVRVTKRILQTTTGLGIFRTFDVAQRSSGDDFAAMNSGAWAKIDNVIGAPHCFLIVLDDHE